MNPPHESALDRFLADLAEGEIVSSGSFTVATEKMLEKLSQAVEDHSVWLLKLAQAAAAAGAALFSVKVGRRSLAVTTLADSHPDLPSAECLLGEAQRTRSHYHLLLALLWAGKTLGTHSVRLRWSTDQTVEELHYDGVSFQTKRFDLEQPNRFQFLKLELERSPLTLIARLFGRSDFSAELHRLEQSTYLTPLSISVDGRQLHRSRFSTESISAGFYHSPGSTDLLRFDMPRRLLKVLPKDRRRSAGAQFEMGQAVLATAYAETLHKPARSRVHWLIDGVHLPAQELPDERGKHGKAYLLFLALEPDATDISTLRPAEERRVQARLADPALWDWLRRL